MSWARLSKFAKGRCKMAAALDREMTAQSAADYLAEKIGDGRAYYSVLQDMRCHKRVCRIPFHKYHEDPHNRAWYYASDLDIFIDAEMKKTLYKRHDYIVERDDTPLASWFPPIKQISIEM